MCNAHFYRKDIDNKRYKKKNAKIKTKSGAKSVLLLPVLVKIKEKMLTKATS